MYSDSPLVDYYHAVNSGNGHAYNCAFGAGADCDCPASEFRGFIVEIWFDNKFIVVAAEREARVANHIASNWRRTREVRETTRTFRDWDDSFFKLEEVAEHWRDRLDDWASD